VSYRFISPDQLHCYTINSNSKVEVNFYSCDLDVIPVMEKGVMNFIENDKKGNTVRVTENDFEGGKLKVYSPNKYISEFPLSFAFFKNETKKDLNISFNVSYGKKSTKDCEIIEFPGETKVQFAVKQKESKIILIRKYFPESQGQFGYKTI